MKTSRIRSRAFTLIELLVVIAIIAILAAILFPVFAQAKASAKSAVTLSNTKQLALGAKIYASDFDDTTIHAGYDSAPWPMWPVLIQPYLKNENIVYDAARAIPEWKGPRFINESWCGPTPCPTWSWNVNIGINIYGYASQSTAHSAPRSETSFESISQRAAFVVHGKEMGGDWTYGLDRGHFIDNQNMLCPNYANYRNTAQWQWWFNTVYHAAADFHNGGIITAFADGSAKKIPAKRVTFDSRNYGTPEACRQENVFNFRDNRALVPNQKQLDAHLYWGRVWDFTF